jgi:hypothetical protein
LLLQVLLAEAALMDLEQQLDIQQQDFYFLGVHLAAGPPAAALALLLQHKLHLLYLLQELVVELPSQLALVPMVYLLVNH